MYKDLTARTVSRLRDMADAAAPLNMTVGLDAFVDEIIWNPFVENPLISTGAGDHFDAGFCLAKQLGLTDDEAATAAVGTSGYYVRHAESPSLDQLAEFLEGQLAE